PDHAYRTREGSRASWRPTNATPGSPTSDASSPCDVPPDVPPPVTSPPRVVSPGASSPGASSSGVPSSGEAPPEDVFADVPAPVEPRSPVSSPELACASGPSCPAVVVVVVGSLPFEQPSNPTKHHHVLLARIVIVPGILRRDRPADTPASASRARGSPDLMTSASRMRCEHDFHRLAICGSAQA